MRHEKKDDKLFVVEENTDMCEGYLRHMRRYDTFPKKSNMLAVAFGHQGKLRIFNAIGYMKTIQEVATLDALPGAATGEYNLVAVYYVAENLDDGELPTFFQHINGLLPSGGSLMVVVDSKEGHKALKDVKRECEGLGFKEVQTDYWRSEPLNHWDRLTDNGRPLPGWQQRCALLRKWRGKTASALLLKSEK